MKLSRFVIPVVAAMVAASSASAQVVGVGSTKGGVLAAVAATVSKVISQHAGMQMRTQPMAGTQQYIPVVNAGEMEFGISNVIQFNMALAGTGLSKGHKYGNLRVVGKLMTFRISPIVATRSGMTKLADIKGKRVPYGFKGAPLFQILFTSFLANAGLTWDDVVKVPVVGLRQHWNIFKQGKLDLSVGNPGTGINKELNATIKGGIRHISFANKGPGPEAMLKMLPMSFYMKLEPNPKFPTMPETSYMVAYPFVLWTHKGVKDDTVYRVAKAMYEHAADLKSVGPVWKSYNPKDLSQDYGGTFHPGATRLYKEVGIWKR